MQMARLLRSWALGIFTMAIAGITGCGTSLVPVEGQATVDGKALEKGGVVLWPDSKKGNNYTGSPTGSVVGGKFQIMTEGRAGAPAGWYKVTLTSVDDIPDSTKATIKPNLVNQRYREAATTLLEFEVVASPAPGAYDLKTHAK